MDTFEEYIKKAMAQRRVNQRELADGVGVTPAQMSRIIKGERGRTPEVLNKLAVFLGLDPVTVFRKGGALPEPPSPEADAILDQIDYLYSTLKDPTNKQRALDYLELLLKQEEKGNFNATQNTKTQPR